MSESEAVNLGSLYRQTLGTSFIFHDSSAHIWSRYLTSGFEGFHALFPWFPRLRSSQLLRLQFLKMAVTHSFSALVSQEHHLVHILNLLLGRSWILYLLKGIYCTELRGSFLGEHFSAKLLVWQGMNKDKGL